jgi:hypothetical protein
MNTERCARESSSNLRQMEAARPSEVSTSDLHSSALLRAWPRGMQYYSLSSIPPAEPWPRSALFQRNDGEA